MGEVTQRVTRVIMALFSGEHLDAETTRLWLTLMLRRYSAVPRYHHTLARIDGMLRAAHAARRHVHDLKVLRLAILFHDIAFDACRSDHETLSMQLFCAFAQVARLSAHCTACVLHLIGSTKRLPRAGWHRFDEALFFDLTAHIAASSPETYRAYAIGIRTLYAHVPDPLFGHLRSALLRQQLKRPSIFLTPYGIAHHEQVARANLLQELSELRHMTSGVRAQWTIGRYRVLPASRKRFEEMKDLTR